MPSCTPLNRNTIQRFDPIKDDSWDKHVQTHPSASFFHTTNWARVLHGTYGHTPLYFGVFDGDSVLASVPLMEVRSLLTGKRGVVLPFTDECALLLSNNAMTEESFQDVFQEVLSIGRQRRWKYLELRSCTLDGWDPPASDSHWGHVLDLTQGVDAAFQGFHSSVRRAIRKAEKSNVEILFSNSLEGVQTYYALHCRTRKKLGVPPQPFRFFRNIHEHVLQKGTGVIATALHQGTPIAAAVFVHSGSDGIYKFGASDEAFLQLRGNDLIMWETIKWYAARGFASLSFGRTEQSNEGLRRFKLGFGTREYPIKYYRYDFRREAFTNAHGNNHAWVNRILRRIPVPVLRVLGAAIYNHSS